MFRLSFTTTIWRNIGVCLSLAGATPHVLACEKVNPSAYDDVTYYSETHGLNGVELKQALNRIISGHRAHPYTPCTWRILEEADQDPNNPKNIMTLYTRRSVPKARWDRGKGDVNSWNREHVWPKSRGFRSRESHAFSDVHMLRAADQSTNADRSSKDFANGGHHHSECKACRVTNSTWQAPQEVQGDIARSLFYMETRYDGSDYKQSHTPKLSLISGRSYYKQPKLGHLCDLMAWHLDDPVSSEELSRNEVIYTWQGNRNPFIDHPEWVMSIWGDSCYVDSENES